MDILISNCCKIYNKLYKYFDQEKTEINIIYCCKKYFYYWLMLLLFSWLCDRIRTVVRLNKNNKQNHASFKNHCPEAKQKQREQSTLNTEAEEFGEWKGNF